MMKTASNSCQNYLIDSVQIKQLSNFKAIRKKWLIDYGTMDSQQAVATVEEKQ